MATFAHILRTTIEPVHLPGIVILGTVLNERLAKFLDTCTINIATENEYLYLYLKYNLKFHDHNFPCYRYEIHLGELNANFNDLQCMEIRTSIENAYCDFLLRTIKVFQKEKFYSELICDWKSCQNNEFVTNERYNIQDHLFFDLKNDYSNSKVHSTESDLEKIYRTIGKGIETVEEAGLTIDEVELYKETLHVNGYEIELSQYDSSESRINRLALIRNRKKVIINQNPTLEQIVNYVKGLGLVGMDFTDYNLIEADFSNQDLSNAKFCNANLVDVDLREANLSNADFTGCILQGSKVTLEQLLVANLSQIKADLFNVLSNAPNEIKIIKNALINGKIEGMDYFGDCCCLIGTIAKARDCDIEDIPGIIPDIQRPIERWFLAIKGGDTPQNNVFSAITLMWIDEFLTTHLID